jgi:hypothetical protein
MIFTSHCLLFQYTTSCQVLEAKSNVLANSTVTVTIGNLVFYIADYCIATNDSWIQFFKYFMEVT